MSRRPALLVSQPSTHPGAAPLRCCHARHSGRKRKLAPALDLQSLLAHGRECLPDLSRGVRGNVTPRVARRTQGGYDDAFAAIDTSDGYTFFTQRGKHVGSDPRTYETSVVEGLSRTIDRGTNGEAPDVYRCACRGLAEELGLHEAVDFAVAIDTSAFHT